MDDLEEFVKSQGDFAEETAKAISNLSQAVDLLTLRVIALETDLKKVEENLGIRSK